MLAILLNSCVHDDKYDNPEDAASYQCMDLTANLSLEELKNLPQNVTFNDADEKIIEGYVSSSDETGNIYKYLYIQDKPENPTQGLVISLDAVSTYGKYPQGSKVYIKLNGLALGKYGNFIQLGAMDVNGTFARIPEKEVPTHIYRSCGEKEKIVPKVMKLNELGTANDQYVGVLVQINNAEFARNTMCMQYAPEATSVDRQLNDATSSATTKVVRNSGYASFANKTLPSGNGTFVGILSKYNSTYQFYIVKDTDLDMKSFPRIDGITSAPCAPDESAAKKTVAQVKQYYNGGLTQITENATLTAKVIGNDESGNLYKYLYVEDATGGIRININQQDLYLDRRFQVGRTLIVNLNGLYINNINGEMQLGGLYNGNLGQVELADVYKHFFGSGLPITTVTPTERTLDQLKPEDVGRWIKIKNLQFIDGDLGKTYADGGVTTNRTLEDCNGNTILLRTSNYADFGTKDYPLEATKVEIDPGKGDVYAILSAYNGTYQLWILNLRNIDLDNPRCDGTLPDKTETIFSEGFNNLNSWTSVNVLGAEVWGVSNQGQGSNYYAMMNGYSGTNHANEDWLISPIISLAGLVEANLSFDSDVRYNGSPLKLYITDNYSNDPASTSWTELSANWDTNSGGFGFVNSGKIDLSSFLGKDVRIAFKYVSTTSAANTWEIDNFLIKGKK